MQAALCINPSSTLSFPPPLRPPPQKSATTIFRMVSPPHTSRSCLSYPKAATSTYDSFTVDYSSITSVFPAEACETIGGDACLADIYPEVRLKPSPIRNADPPALEPVDREYLDYNSPKTVFCAEACDDLGGEFCSRDYQRGVY